MRNENDIWHKDKGVIIIAIHKLTIFNTTKSTDKQYFNTS